MSIEIRPVSLTDDREEMIEILKRNFGPGQDIRFSWRNLDNPAGEAWAWFAYERDSKKTVGTVSVFPRRMYVDGKAVVCGQVGAFAVDAGHRSLGPAVMLQRATFEPVDSARLAFCYDCPPNDHGMSTFARLGMRPSCEITRYALPLRSDKFLQKRLGGGVWTRPLISAANLFLALRTRGRGASNVEIGKMRGPFGEEFSDLDRRVASQGLIRACRSADVLNWRYRQNPVLETDVLVARRAGELLAFFTLCTSNDGSFIGDLFGLQLTDVAPALLAAAVETCKRRRVHSLFGYCSADGELKGIFRRLGFRPRESNAKVVAYENAASSSNELLDQRLRWTFGQAELIV